MPESPLSAKRLCRFQAAIDDCLLKDRARLRRRLTKLEKRAASGTADAALLSSLEQDIQRSEQTLAGRRAWRIAPEFPATLPVSMARADIRAAIEQNQVVILAGETGSGKTTQLPKICLEMGRGLGGQIGHTQPRRIAARSVARRIAAELGTDVGQVVGYQTRFDKSVSDTSRVKLMTDGILLSELRHDRQLWQYDTLIVDEAHERSLNIDFLLGYLHTLLKRRRDLKLIITSATIDTEKFSRHFGDAPVLEISGRTYPVDIEYLPENADEESDTAEGVAHAVARILTAHGKRGAGGILVFLPGERDIGECRDLLRKRFHEQLEILPLFGRLSARDQDKVFAGVGKPRCVLATNIAETSLTVPGIRFVIDTGLARVSRYSVRSKVQQLPIEKISQASARQRAGRCGRLENGLCFRLYSEEDFLSRAEHTEPEIRRTNLARVILEMAALRLGEIENFPFIDRPDDRYIRDGYRLLQELQAVDEQGRVLATGRRMARLPVDPRIARMLLAAAERRCMVDMLVVAAALSVPDPRQRPADRCDDADRQHASFADPQSDFIGILNLWRSWKSEQQAGSGSRLRRWCKAHFLSYTRMREWQDLVHQLHGLSGDTRKASVAARDRYAALHGALLCGLLGHVGMRNEEGAYQGTRGRVFHVFPGSGIGTPRPQWLVAAQLIETSRLFAHTVAKVRPEWIEKAAGHLVKRSYGSPAWNARQGRVIARETVTLYGLVLAAGRRVDYGSVAPTEARGFFIRDALVRHRLGFEPSFLEHNRRLVERIKDLEDRSRRHDVLVDDEVQCGFYEERLPAGVHDAAGLRHWIRKARPESLKMLHMDRGMLMRHPADDVTEERFPDEIEVAGNRFELAYHFERGSPDDGVTVTVPAGLLNQLPADAFDYLVPGLLPEKLETLLRGLPKSLRRNFVPVPRFARAALEDLPSPRPPLCAWLSGKLTRMSGAPVSAQELSAVVLPEHLCMNFRVVSESGEVLGESRDLHELRDRLGDLARRVASRSLASDQGRSGLKSWDFGELPARIETKQNGRHVVLFPALEDVGDSVNLIFHDDEELARSITESGLVRLARLALPQQQQMIGRALRSCTRDLLGWRRHGDEPELAEQIFEHLAREHFLRGQQPMPRDRDAFVKQLDDFRSRLVSDAEALIPLIAEILSLETGVRRRAGELANDACASSLDDIRAQLARLLGPDFPGRTEARWLARFPVYLRALDIRLKKLPGNVSQDRANMALVAPGEEALAALSESHPWLVARPSVREYRWMLEELRVSIFAQKLGTVCKVSPVRLRRYWEQKIASLM